MAVPARRISKTRKNKRRSNVWKLAAPTLVKCPNCGETLNSFVSQCPTCNFELRNTNATNSVRELSFKLEQIGNEKTHTTKTKSTKKKLK